MIVLVSACEEDERAFRRMVGSEAVAAVRGVAEARAAIGRWRPAIVVCDTETSGAGSWRDLLGVRDGGNFALVVMARHADERLWAEVLNLGGFDVLAKPLRREEVAHVISSALRRHGREALDHWEEYQIENAD